MYQINFILEWHSACFGQSFRPLSGVQDCAYGNRHLSNRYGCLLASKQAAVFDRHLSNRYGCLLASKQAAVFDKCLLLYAQSWTPDNGRKDCPKHAECRSKIKLIWYIGASSWFYYTGSSKKMDRIWNPYNFKSTRRIYTFGILKCSEKFKVLDLRKLF